jgi:hypothetical protein
MLEDPDLQESSRGIGGISRPMNTASISACIVDFQNASPADRGSPTGQTAATPFRPCLADRATRALLV